MPGGRPSKPSVPEDASCLSLCLPIQIQCITCKRARNSIDCKKPWGKNWLKSSKEEDYFSAWDHLERNNYRLPRECLNARRKRVPVGTSEGLNIKRRRTKSVSCIMN